MLPIIHLASDHAGFSLKEIIKTHLETQDYNIKDYGTNNTASCDYPVFAKNLCTGLLKQGGMGILICGTGIGMSMMANRIKGIRAALCCNEFQARATRAHNDANVLCLGERVTGTGIAIDLVNIFLNTNFESGRHQTRIDLIDN